MPGLLGLAMSSGGVSAGQIPEAGTGAFTTCPGPCMGVFLDFLQLLILDQALRRTSCQNVVILDI